MPVISRSLLSGSGLVLLPPNATLRCCDKLQMSEFGLHKSKLFFHPSAVKWLHLCVRLQILMPSTVHTPMSIHPSHGLFSNTGKSYLNLTSGIEPQEQVCTNSLPKHYVFLSYLIARYLIKTTSKTHLLPD